MSFVRITDLHFMPKGQRLCGLDPKARLEVGVEMINEQHSGADFVLITGDLAHLGQREAYESLKDSLDKLTLPYHVLMGNHDLRAPFSAVFPDVPAIEGGFHQYVLTTPKSHIICLDTLNEDTADHSGKLCDIRLRWLQDQISRLPEDKHFILSGHHPFFNIGIPNMDDLPLRDPAALMEVLQVRKPDMYLYGHIHRPICGVHQGIPYHTLHGFNHQVALTFQRHPILLYSHEPAELSVVLEEPDGLIVHTQLVDPDTKVFPAVEVFPENAD